MDGPDAAFRFSGVAGPSAARGCGQICRPFHLGFGNWRAGFYKA